MNEGVVVFQKKSTTQGIPRQSPIQVLTLPYTA